MTFVKKFGAAVLHAHIEPDSGTTSQEPLAKSVLWKDCAVQFTTTNRMLLFAVDECEPEALFRALLTLGCPTHSHMLAALGVAETNVVKGVCTSQPVGQDDQEEYHGTPANRVEMTVSEKTDVSRRLVARVDSTLVLHAACERGCAQGVAAMVAFAPRVVDVEDAYCGRTPLAVAVMFGHHACTDILLKAKARVNLGSSIDGVTPLMHAAHRRDSTIDTLRRLVRARASVNTRAENNTAVCFAATNPNSAVLRCVWHVSRLLFPFVILVSLACDSAGTATVTCRFDACACVRVPLQRDARLRRHDDDAWLPSTLRLACPSCGPAPHTLRDVVPRALPAVVRVAFADTYWTPEEIQTARTLLQAR